MQTQIPGTSKPSEQGARTPHNIIGNWIIVIMR